MSAESCTATFEFRASDHSSITLTCDIEGDHRHDVNHAHFIRSEGGRLVATVSWEGQHVVFTDSFRVEEHE